MFERLKAFLAFIGFERPPEFNPHVRKFIGGSVAGAASAAVQATGIAAEGMSAEAAVNLVNTLRQKMGAISDTTVSIEYASKRLKDGERKLYPTIIDGREWDIWEIASSIAGVDNFEETLRTPIGEMWNTGTQDYAKSYRHGIEELVRTIGDQSIKIPRSMLDWRIFGDMPVDEEERVNINKNVLAQLYPADAHDTVLSAMPEQASKLWNEGTSFTQTFKTFSEKLLKSPLKDFTPQAVYADLSDNTPGGAEELRAKIARMNQDDGFFQKEIEEVQRVTKAKNAVEAEQRRQERQQEDKIYAQNWAPILSTFLGKVEWHENGDCLEAYIPNDAGGKRAFLAMVDLLKEKGARENELPTFEDTVFRRDTAGEKANYPENVPVPTYKVLSLQKHHVPVLARLIMGSGELNLHPDNVETTLFRRASLLKEMRELGVVKQKTDSSRKDGQGLA